MWHKFGKNGEAKSRMIKMFVSSIRPRSARIRPVCVNMEAPISLKV
jgi:ABC-type antimicrobial peptide transport system ATPase subunit